MSQRQEITARPATPDDLEAIYRVAASVGHGQKDPLQGFLMADYTADPEYYKGKLRNQLEQLSLTYVAIAGCQQLVGFLMAYTGEQWLGENPLWFQEVQWHPTFPQDRLGNFALVDKTAVIAGSTARGIGSTLYRALIATLEVQGVTTLFGETVISPVPNLASLAFRRKQNYHLAGVRYEMLLGQYLTDLVYWKDLTTGT